MANIKQSTPPLYSASGFAAGSMEAAQNLSCPPSSATQDSKVRWQKESDYIFQQFCTYSKLKSGDWVLDYGCGAGRLSRLLCNNGINVIGVDSSADMRKYAEEYVNNPERFICIPPEMLDSLLAAGLRVDYVCCNFVLQHCPPDEVELFCNRVHQAAARQSYIYIANNKTARRIPVMTDSLQWIEDNYNVWQTLERHFGLCGTKTLPAEFDPKQEILIRTYICSAKVPPRKK